ncbi:hypothetical protein [Massilia eburnea]|nr:hypothetical protein [Massilia eburnea]
MPPQVTLADLTVGQELSEVAEARINVKVKAGHNVQSNWLSERAA